MDFDPGHALQRFRKMTRDELLEEAALHAEEYVPEVGAMLEGERLARGISAAELAARRAAAAAPPREPDVDLPALIASAAQREELRELAEALRREGLPGVVREVDPMRFHGSRHAVGRWGLFVPGPHAVDAARRLEEMFPAAGPAAAAGCGGCGASCADACDGDGALAAEPAQWDEDGDWWKTGAPGEEEQ